MPSSSCKVAIKRLANAADLPLPRYETEGSAGVDLAAAIDNDIVLHPGEYKLIPTGFAIELDKGFEAQVRPRSGLALKHGITVLNTPGTIDSDYRGEVAVILINHSQTAFTISHGMRIAQLIVAPVVQAHFSVQTELSETARNQGGFGSTGTQTRLEKTPA